MGVQVRDEERATHHGARGDNTQTKRGRRWKEEEKVMAVWIRMSGSHH